MFEFRSFKKTCINEHFLGIVAFITNVDELQALLDARSSTQEYELLLESILVPNECKSVLKIGIRGAIT